MTARKLSVSLSKGGVGKTTTSINIAAGLANQGNRVLLIDTDTQNHVARSLGIHTEAGLAELVSGKLSVSEAATQARDNLFILAGGESMAGVKHEISRRDVGASFVLMEALESAENDWDWIIVDTSPGWDAIAVNVLVYVDDVLTPVSLASMSVYGLIDFSKQLERIRRYHPQAAAHRYVLPTFLDRRAKEPIQILGQLQKYYADKICDPIRYNIRLAEAPGHGMTIFEYAPKSKGAKDYETLVNRMVKDGT